MPPSTLVAQKFLRCEISSPISTNALSTASAVWNEEKEKQKRAYSKRYGNRTGSGPFSTNQENDRQSKDHLQEEH